MDGFDRAVLERLPLAEAALLVLAHATEEPFLEDLYDRHRGRSYEKVLSFSVLVRLIGDALVEHKGSARQSFDRAAEEGTMPVTSSAVYRKLGRIPLAVTQAMVAETTLRLVPLLATKFNPAIPASLQEMSLLAIDGKKIKHVAKRAKPLRELPGSVLAAKVLVALRLEDGLVVALEANPDGEANDCPLVGGLLDQVRHVVGGPRLFIADRQFCGSDQLDQFAAQGDFYLIRRTTTARFTPDPNHPSREDVDARGRHYVDCRGTLGNGNKAREVRQITLTRPGEETITLITNLLDAEAYPAADLLEAYLMRWGIERVFQQITEVFSLQRLIGGTPQAGVFQCGFCLLLYNVLQVVRQLVAISHEREPESISSEQLFNDTQRQIITLQTLGSLEKAREQPTQHRTASETKDRLVGLLSTTWSKRWLKAPGKKKTPPRTKAQQSGAHTSVLRARQAYEENRRRDEKEEKDGGQ